MSTRRVALLGIDVGTSGCKGVVLDAGRRLVAGASVSYPTRRRPDGEVTQNPRDWERAVVEVTRQCLLQVPDLEVVAVGVTAPAHYAVLLGSSGRPLARCIIASDGRPAGTAAALARELGADYAEITGMQMNSTLSLPQLAWLSKSDPNMFEQVRHVLVAKDYVRFRMTGERSTDHSDAAGTGLYDIHRRTWSAPLVELANLATDQLPPILESSAPGGKVTPRFARATGLRVGTPVVVGATDTAAELVSLGATMAGAAIVKIASTGVVVVVGDQLPNAPQLLNYPHAVNGQWYTAAVTNTASTAYSWFASVVCEGAPGTGGPSLAALDQRAASVEPGANGLLFLPFLEGKRSPVWDAAQRAAFVGLTSSHRLPHFVRAVLEGVALSLRECRDAVVAAGMPVGDIYLTGGGSGSPLWRKITAAVFDQTCWTPSPHGPAIGSALLAGGLTPGYAGTAPLPPRLKRTRVDADPVWAARYHDVYLSYQDVAKALSVATAAR